MADQETQPTKVEIGEKVAKFDGFFKLDEYRVKHELFEKGGELSKEQTLLVFERGDAVAALLYDPAERKVILVSQFRLPAKLRGGSGWILEPAAGKIDADKSEAQRERELLREIAEETGYQVTKAVPIASFFVSPGGTTERIYLYYAEVRATDKVTSRRIHGNEAEGENIRREEIPLEMFLRQLDDGEFEDAKLIIAGQWLRQRSLKLDAGSRGERGERRKFPVIDAARAGSTERLVWYIPGDIADVKDVDAWVNSENTDMMMDQFFGNSVSAKIRLLGAKKYPGERLRLKEDTIGNA